MEISFLSGGFLLKGTLHLPAVKRPPVVIGSHGLCSTSNSPKQVALARECTAHGIAYFRFDHRGCGQSQGLFREVTSLEARHADLLNAIECIRSRTDTGGQLGLFGSSMGGAVCISVASTFAVDAMVTYAAPVHSDSIIEALNKKDGSNRLEALFNEKYLQSDISDKLSRLHHILIVHGNADEVVPPSNAHQIYSKAGSPKKLIMQKHGDHRMSNNKHQENFIKEAASWFKTCFKG
ncbi:MAG: alpha/beta fold hydrolase [Pseudomonadota bacterium]|uniref:Alpha/beta fold hydrolase n=1 Tax=Candidatus Desulfatibia profunda TaxID=2841695 RepID=A0A8J6TIM5_9BACT|nr:alpha/beta fold hydrolase [Candidatus Desulfatibia profunda]